MIEGHLILISQRLHLLHHLQTSSSATIIIPFFNLNMFEHILGGLSLLHMFEPCIIIIIKVKSQRLLHKRKNVWKINK